MSASASPPVREYGFGAKLWNFHVVLLIFLLVGPPLGAIVSLGMLAVSHPNDARFLFELMTLRSLIISWLVFGVPAFLTGLLFATHQTFIGRAHWAMAGLVGIVVGLCLAVLIDDNARELRYGPALSICLVGGFAATMACCLLTRSFVTAGPRPVLASEWPAP